MPVGLTGQRTWSSVNGPAPGNNITSSLFINNWIQTLLNRVTYLREEAISTQTHSIVSDATILTGVESAVLHLTALDTDTTHTLMTVTFGAVSFGDDRVRRLVVVDKLSAGSTLRVLDHTPTEITSYTARQDEFGLVFEYARKTGGWVLLRRHMDNIRPPLAQVVTAGSSSPSWTGLTARHLRVKVDGFAISGTASLTFDRPANDNEIRWVFVDSVAATGSVTINEDTGSGVNTIGTYNPKGSVSGVLIVLISDSVSGMKVLHMGENKRDLFVSTIPAPGSSPVNVLSGIDYVRVTGTLTQNPISFRLANGTYDGQMFTLHVDDKDSGGGSISLASAAGTIFLATTEDGSDVTLKARWVSGAWRSEGASVGLP